MSDRCGQYRGISGELAGKVPTGRTLPATPAAPTGRCDPCVPHRMWSTCVVAPPAHTISSSVSVRFQSMTSSTRPTQPAQVPEPPIRTRHGCPDVAGAVPAGGLQLAVQVQTEGAAIVRQDHVLPSSRRRCADIAGLAGVGPPVGRAVGPDDVLVEATAAAPVSLPEQVLGRARALVVDPHRPGERLAVVERDVVGRPDPDGAVPSKSNASPNMPESPSRCLRSCRRVARPHPARRHCPASTRRGRPRNSWRCSRSSSAQRA